MNWSTVYLCSVALLTYGAARGDQLSAVETPEQISAPEIWTVLSPDPKGDSHGDAATDAAQLSYRYDRVADILWFRIVVYGAPSKSAFGLQIGVDSGGDPAEKAAWPGENQSFRFDRLVVAKVNRRGDEYVGTIGVTDAEGASRGDFSRVSRHVQLRVDSDAYVLGVSRGDLTQGKKMDIVASVGSDREWDDEIPTLKPASIDLAAPRPTRGLKEIDLTRNNLQLPPGLRALTEDEAPSIERTGHGSAKALILIPGVFSGPDVFGPFIARHMGDYRMFIVTPPGLNGTRPRRMPAEGVSYGDRPWTTRLSRDVLDLIQRERLMSPVIVSHGYPGSLVATAIAAHHPAAVGGVIEIAAFPPGFLPSPSDRTGKTPMSVQERSLYADALQAPKWFRYVTPETWESNNYPAAMFQNDPDRAEAARRSIESVPLPVKIRYLVEVTANDDGEDILRISIPFLALRPGFSAEVLADPLNTWFKTYFVDNWDRFSTNKNIELRTIPNTRALVFQDQLPAADQAIGDFLSRIAAGPWGTLG